MPKSALVTTTHDKPISKLWYKNYLVWIFVIALPLLVVLGCVGFVVYSVRIQDSVVRDDWYMDGKTLYADVSKDKLAHDLGLSGQLTLHSPDAQFVLNAPLNSTFVPPQTLNVQISHATQIQKDRDFVMTKTPEGAYHGKVTLDNVQGKYYLIIRDPQNTWRLQTRAQLPSPNAVVFQPLKAFDRETIPNHQTNSKTIASP